MGECLKLAAMKHVLIVLLALGVAAGCGKKEPAPPSASNTEATKPEPTKPEPTKPEPTKPEPTKPEPTKPEPTKLEPTKPEPTKAKATAGSKLWEFETGGAVFSSPAIGSDGTVYFGSGIKLYAIKTDSKGPAKSPWPMFRQNAQRTGRAPAKK